MSKGSQQRPGTGYQDNHERIMPTAPKHCQACGYLPVWCKCAPTGDGRKAGESREDEK